MNELLASQFIETHDTIDRWKSFEKEVTGRPISLKGRPQDPAPPPVTAWLHEEITSISHYRASDRRAVFTPERISNEKLDLLSDNTTLSYCQIKLHIEECDHMPVLVTQRRTLQVPRTCVCQDTVTVMPQSETIIDKY